jgi:hypothetical protein
MMNLIPAQPKVEEKKIMTFEVVEGKGNSFYNFNDINAYNPYGDVTQQLGNFKLFNDNSKMNYAQSERSIMPQQQQSQHMQGIANERQSMKVNKVIPKTFEMDPYSQQSKANMSMYNYNIQHHQQQKQVKPKMMMVDPYANNSNNNNDNSFVQRQQQQQRLPYTNIQQQLNQTQAPYQTYSHNQQERIDFNKFKQNLFFPHEQHARANSNISSSYNEFRRIINNINISDTEISKYLNEYTNNVIIAAERYFQSKYNTPELTLQYIYSQTFRKTHTFSFLARVDELFSQVSMDMPNLSHYKLLFQNGMEITKEMAASFKCIGALDIKNNSLIYVQPL